MVYLTGHLDRHRLEDRIQNGLLHVQIHDRDPLPSSPPSNDSGGNKDRVRSLTCRRLDRLLPLLIAHTCTDL